MIGILTGLIISWLLLYFIEKRNILDLGFLPLLKRLKQFAIGFLVTAILCGIVQYSESLLRSSHWYFNENHSLELILKMFWWNFKSVLTEELIFRGALLFILLKRIGSNKAILVSATAFGIYHWFSFGIFGYLLPMFFVFV
jgi:uncharacterized protein